VSRLFLDLETKSTVELRRSGVYKYAAHVDTDVWVAAWAFDQEEPSIWWPGDPLPDRVRDHIVAGGELWAHNAAFERIMHREVLVPRYGWPSATLEQWHCTAAEAAALTLPRRLEHVCDVLRLPVRKDMEGHRLMLQMCRPRRFEDDGQPIWWADQEKLQRLGAYCATDVKAEQLLFKAIRRLSPAEREVYLHNERMNDRGVALDLELAGAAQKLAKHEIARQNRLLREATGGKVDKITKVAKLKEWVNAQGLDTDTLKSKVLDGLIADAKELAPEVGDALSARKEAAKSSVSKLQAMFDVVDADGRARGLLMYHGASTGRDTGKFIQPQNMPRGLEVKGHELEWIAAVLDGTLPEKAAAAQLTTLTVLSGILRSMIVPARGSVFFCGDYAQIEARVVAWLADCTLMLQQFSEKRPIYIEMAEAIFGKKVSKDMPEYTVGKSAVLGCGFGLGVKKFATQFLDAGPEVLHAIDVLAGFMRRIQQDDRVVLELADLDPEAVKTARLCLKAVDTYRETYPEIVDFWGNLNKAALNAVGREKTTYQVGKLQLRREGAFLWIRLPSSRLLAYHMPAIVQRPMPWNHEDVRPAVEFSGFNSYTHQWERLTTYGGSLAENVTQAIARDLMMAGALRTEAAGFATVLKVHDEVLAEAPAYVLELGGLHHFNELLETPPAWADGLPIAAESWSGTRYKK
jgi:DNA polymerase